MHTANYDHTVAFQEALGIRDATWILGKADRELERYHSAADVDSRLDALLNFCSSVIALEDWALPEGADEATWRASLRSESTAHAFVVLIALIAKHRRLRDGRFSRLRFEAGRIEVWSEEPTPNSILQYISDAMPSAEVVSVRTNIDDDEIAGYSVTIDLHGLTREGRLIPLETVMREALESWRERLTG
ncbi:MAG: hypothetical protein R3F15_17110 [Lysobacterales bacterium]